jgi:hypothetical protein
MMRRIAMFLAVTVVMMVLLLRYPTSRGASAVAHAPGSAGDVGVVSGAAAGSSGGGTGSGSSGGSSTSDSLVVNGTVASTRWGPVQVQVVIAGGRITDVKTLQYPTGNNRDRQINAYALPQLRSRVLAAQSADIDAVSGATVTSEGYIESLQAALDTAHFTK